MFHIDAQVMLSSNTPLDRVVLQTAVLFSMPVFMFLMWTKKSVEGILKVYVP